MEAALKFADGFDLTSVRRSYSALAAGFFRDYSARPLSPGCWSAARAHSASGCYGRNSRTCWHILARRTGCRTRSLGARLPFMLPLLLVAAAAGLASWRRVGTVFGVALFAANAGGVWAYFNTSDILNIAYVAPSRQIAALIAVRSSPADTLVLVDGLNVDAAVLADYLPLNFALGVLRSPADATTAWSILQSNPRIRHVWFLQSPHDISAGHAFEKLQGRMMGAWYSHTLHPYVRASAIQRWVMKYAMHIAAPPGYVYEVWEFRR